MKVASVQPERLIEGLRKAVVVEFPVPSLPARVFAFIMGKESRMRIGVPHGVENVRVSARNVVLDPVKNEIAYCDSFGYITESEVAAGDGQPYPETVESEVACVVSRRGYYDVKMQVSVNGSVTAKILEAVPVTV